MWCGFVIFWEASVLSLKAPDIMKFWGVPFVLIGLYAVVGRFIHDAWIRRGIHYAITNKRILISRSGHLTAMNLERLPDMTLSESTDGRGTIRFGQQSSPWGRGTGFSVWTPALDQTPQFIGIENARNIFNQIQNAQSNVVRQ